MSIVKKIIAPIQHKILEKRICPGCMQKLSEAKQRNPITRETEMVTCQCGRVFIYYRPRRSYRRALENEVR